MITLKVELVYYLYKDNEQKKMWQKKTTIIQFIQPSTIMQGFLECNGRKLFWSLTKTISLCVSSSFSCKALSQDFRKLIFSFTLVGFWFLSYYVFPTKLVIFKSNLVEFDFLVKVKKNWETITKELSQKLKMTSNRSQMTRFHFLCNSCWKNFFDAKFLFNAQKLGEHFAITLEVRVYDFFSILFQLPKTHIKPAVFFLR